MKRTITAFRNEVNSFYPEYLKEHSNSINLVLHFIGATGFFTLVILAFILKIIWLIPLAVFIGYLLPGIGHRHFEHNKSFRSSKPVLCVVCAFRLYLDTICFRLTKRSKNQKTKISFFPSKK